MSQENTDNEVDQALTILKYGPVAFVAAFTDMLKKNKILEKNVIELQQGKKINPTLHNVVDGVLSHSSSGGTEISSQDINCNNIWEKNPYNKSGSCNNRVKCHQCSKNSLSTHSLFTNLEYCKQQSGLSEKVDSQEETQSYVLSSNKLVPHPLLNCFCDLCEKLAQNPTVDKYQIRNGPQFPPNCVVMLKGELVATVAYLGHRRRFTEFVDEAAGLVDRPVGVTVYVWQLGDEEAFLPLEDIEYVFENRPRLPCTVREARERETLRRSSYDDIHLLRSKQEQQEVNPECCNGASKGQPPVPSLIPPPSPSPIITLNSALHSTASSNGASPSRVHEEETSGYQTSSSYSRPSSPHLLSNNSSNYFHFTPDRVLRCHQEGVPLCQRDCLEHHLTSCRQSQSTWERIDPRFTTARQCQSTSYLAGREGRQCHSPRLAVPDLQERWDRGDRLCLCEEEEVAERLRRVPVHLRRFSLDPGVPSWVYEHPLSPALTNLSPNISPHSSRRTSAEGSFGGARSPSYYQHRGSGQHQHCF